MTPFSLYERVKAELTGTDEADPGIIADKIAANLSASNVMLALRTTLRAYVREVMRSERNKTTGASQNDCETHGVRAGAGEPSGRSWKVDAIRTNWASRLRDRIHVGGTEWKLLGDCTFADLCEAAEERKIQADKNMAQAAEYRHMADAIITAGVTTFGQVLNSTCTI